jgi:hypothetical protein
MLVALPIEADDLLRDHTKASRCQLSALVALYEIYGVELT